MSDLDKLRQKIIALDKKLLKTLKERFNVAQKIGKMKKGPIHDPKREHKLLQKWLAQGLDKNFTRALFHMILKESKNLMTNHNLSS